MGEKNCRAPRREGFDKFVRKIVQILLTGDQIMVCLLLMPLVQEGCLLPGNAYPATFSVFSEDFLSTLLTNVVCP